MSIVNLNNLTNKELKKRLASQINLLHKDLHRASAGNQDQEVPKNWTGYKKRIKPLFRDLKEAKHKDYKQGFLLEGLEKLINSNKENMMILVTFLKDSFKKETPAVAAVTSATEIGTRVIKLTKPVKVPTWSRSRALETFKKQLQTWSEINEEIPEWIKYHELIENLKANKDTRDFPRYVGACFSGA